MTPRDELTETKSTGRFRAWIARLGSFDRCEVLPLLTIVLLLIHAPEVWYLRTPLVLVCIAGIAFRRWLHQPSFWYVIATLLGTTIYLNWESADNHKYVITYWALTLCAAFSLPTPQQGASLALSARWLLGLCMLLATLWKVVNPQYDDGGFFEYELIADERFAHFNALVTGVPLENLQQNCELRQLLHEGHLRGAPRELVQLTTSPAVKTCAWFLTWWTVIVEGALAVLFLLPDSRRLAVGRNSLLLIFAATTYAVANVQGFGWMLMLLGIAQCEDRDRDFRLGYLAGFLLIQVYLFPVSAIVDVLAGR